MMGNRQICKKVKKGGRQENEETEKPSKSVEQAKIEIAKTEDLKAGSQQGHTQKGPEDVETGADLRDREAHVGDDEETICHRALFRIGERNVAQPGPGRRTGDLRAEIIGVETFDYEI